MTVYIGVDFQPHQQTVAWCDTATGETDIRDLFHKPGEVKRFYASFTKPAIIGMEASSRAIWFEKLIKNLWRFIISNASHNAAVNGEPRSGESSTRSVRA